jgi:hypothetical protein
MHTYISFLVDQLLSGCLMNNHCLIRRGFDTHCQIPNKLRNFIKLSRQVFKKFDKNSRLETYELGQANYKMENISCFKDWLDHSIPISHNYGQNPNFTTFFQEFNLME